MEIIFFVFGVIFLGMFLLILIAALAGARRQTRGRPHRRGGSDFSGGSDSDYSGGSWYDGSSGSSYDSGGSSSSDSGSSSSSSSD
ncbi:hypothetical protein [Nocardia crassostreae]|uniref:hypothetical protein n=1 Tax=Nocardia crassostreae TaxID=53428 RepID=UPI000835B051|nr:hypothetical protein [Nocardia crassostreae]